MIQSPRRRRGIATHVALVTMSIVAAALLALASLFATEAGRTRHERAEAQLRQLLIAAAATVGDDLTMAQPGEIAPGVRILALPDELADDVKVTIDYQPGAESTLITRIEAAAGRRRAGQVLHWQRDKDQWILKSAELISAMHPD